MEKLHSSFDEEYMPMKRMGENLVPIGCYYDPEERRKELIKRIIDSVIVGITLIHAEILKTFHIKTKDITYEITYYYPGKKHTVTFPHVLWIIEDYAKNIDFAEEFSLEIIINCTERLMSDNINLWGTVINSHCWMEDYYYKKNDENFPVYIYSLGHIFTNIDAPFDDDDYKKLISKVISDIMDDFNIP